MNMDNLQIVSRQNDVAPFYNEASIVLNLSDKRRFVETFGLTALEAMSAGLPVIVPTKGGIAEMVEDGVNGYKIDVQELEKIESHITTLLSNRDSYLQLAGKALEYSRNFNDEKMISGVVSILESEI